MEAGADLAPDDTLGVLLSRAGRRSARRAGRRYPRRSSDGSIRRSPPPAVGAAAGRPRHRTVDLRLPAGSARSSRRSPVMQRLSANAAATIRASIVVVKVRDDGAVDAVAERLRARFPRLEVSSVADLVRPLPAPPRLLPAALLHPRHAEPRRHRPARSRTLLTITVNERRGEIATLRAIGVSRATIVRQVLAEGTALTRHRRRRSACCSASPRRATWTASSRASRGCRRRSRSSSPARIPIATAAIVLLVTGSLAGAVSAWLAARAPIAATLRSEAT